MSNQKMQIISQLMEELQGLMSPTGDDFDERLGRPKKPGLEVMKVQGEMPMDGKSMEGDMDEEDPMMDDDMEMMSPEMKLKERIAKMRG